MKLLLLLSALLVANYAHSKEARHPACKDPVYACQDLTTARSCGVVTDCIHDIWSTMRAPDDNNEICDICKEMVKEARDQLLSNETQEEIKEVFEGSCELFQIKVIVDECKKIFDDLIPEIIEMLASRMDPNMVCTVAGLCNNAFLKGEDKLPLLEFLSSLVKDSVCDNCKILLSSVKHIVNTIPEDQMQQILTRSCGLLPEFSEQCNAYVTTYLPAAYNCINAMDPESTCDSIGVCSESNAVGKIVSNYGDNLTCEFCESLVQHLRDVILSNTTKEEFKTALLNMCSYLGEFSSECKSLVNDYYDMIYDFIDENLDPEKVCTALGLCQSSNKKTIPLVRVIPSLTMWKGKHPNRIDAPLQKNEKTSVIPAVKVIPAQLTTKKKSNLREGEQDISNEIGDEPMKQLPIERMQHPLLTQDVDCAFSKAVMFFLEKDTTIKENKAIRTALDNVCDTWLLGYKKECEHYVQGNREKIVETLLRGIPFVEVTDHLGVCHEAKLAGVKVVTPVQSSNDIKCDVCVQVMNYVKDKLKDKKTEEEIRNALNEACTYLPQYILQECQQFVNQYTDTIIQLLLQEVDPNKICSDLGLCPPTNDVIKPMRNKIATIKPLKSSADCEICSSIIGYLENELKDKSVEDDIRRALDVVCSVLPQKFSVKCQELVDKHAEEIINFFVQNVDPSLICSLLKECPSQNIECILCQYGLHFLQEQLMSNTTEAEIKSMLKMVCSYLPKEIAVQCNAFVEEYGDALIVLVAQQLDPSTICPIFHLCPSKSLPKELPAMPLKPVKMDGCSICKVIVDYIDQLLEEGDVDKELTDLAAKICMVLSGDAEQECISIVHIYGPYILQMIGKLEDSQQLCQSIDLCARTRGHAHLIGAEKCTYGPSYWCKSHAHAVACKAEMYCKQTVWKNV